LVNGESEYFIACNKNCAVYHKDGQKVSKDFSRYYIMDINKMTFDENLGIMEIQKDNQKVKTIEFLPVFK
jgi:hypothetical protein